MQPAREVAQRGETLFEGDGRFADERLHRGAAGLRDGPPQPDRGLDQALLGPVVQVTLEPTACLVGGGDEARARSLSSAVVIGRPRERCVEDGVGERPDDRGGQGVPHARDRDEA